MSLSKNQRELLKIAKTLVGMVLGNEKSSLAQDEEENLNHVHRLLDWHTAEKVEHKPVKQYESWIPGEIKYGMAMPWDDYKDEVVYDSIMKQMVAPKKKAKTTDGLPCPMGLVLGPCTCLE